MLVNKNFNSEAACPGPDAQSGNITLHSVGKGLCCLGFLCPLKPQVLIPCLYQACGRFESGNEPFRSRNFWGQARVCCLMGPSAVSVDCEHTKAQPCRGSRDEAKVLSSSLQPSVIEH